MGVSGAMRFKPDKKYVNIAILAFGVIAASILFAMGIQKVPSLIGNFFFILTFIKPIVLGIVIAYLLNPLLRMYDNRTLPFVFRGRLKGKARRVVAMLLTYITAILAITAFISLLLPQLATSIRSLSSNIPGYIRSMEGMFSDVTTRAQSADSGTVLGSILGALMSGLNDFLGHLYSILLGAIPKLLTAGANFAVGLLNILIGFIMSAYFLYDREKLMAQTSKAAHAFLPQKWIQPIYDVLKDCHHIMNGFITGRIIDSAIIGVLCFIGMSILRLPYAILISVVVGVTNIIPFVGPFLGAIPSALIIFIDSPMQTLWFVIFILVLQQFDGNILGPKVMGDTLGLSALWIVFGLLLFGGMFGIVGVFLGVPLVAIGYTLFKRLVEKLLRKKQLSVSTADYAGEQNPLLVSAGRKRRMKTNPKKLQEESPED